jgi:ribosomal subunit interface protein
MNIEVRGKDIELPAEFRAYVARKIDTALGRFGDRIAEVRVGIADVNAPRGGADKTCRVEVRGARAWEVIVTAADANLYTAVHQAGDRVGRAVSRALARSRTLARSS